MDRRRALMSIGADAPKTNIIHCVYRAHVDDIDEYGGVILFEERFDISQVDWIRVWYDDVTEEIFDPTVDDILFLPLSPGDWRIDIKVNNLTNCHCMFAYTGLLSADFSEVDISMITNCDSMFYHCDKLIKSPFDVLPIKELTAGCCAFMFQECSNLTKAPELPASILVDSCYIGMFLDCVSLNYIKMLATDISASGCLSNWVHGVSPTGTFVANKDATWDTTPGALDTSGVPAGWTVVNDGEESGGDSLFPATLIYSNLVENMPNYTIAQYFWDTYPDMFVGFNGRYSPITEDVTIQGTNYCDGKVVGVAKWPNYDENYQAVVFYTENSINNLHGLRVCTQFEGLPQGSTNEMFFD